MIKFKKALAFALAVCAVCSAVGCSSLGDNSEAVTTTVKKVKVDDTDKISAIPSGSDKTIRWMGTYDLNPAKGADKSVEMTLFNKKGGKVEYTQVVDSEKFDKLAGAIMSQKNVPDIFKYEWMAFPSQVLKKMYQPVDSIVDFNSDLWKDVKSSADQFVMKDKHYVAPISFTVGTLMMYDNEVIQNNGLDDPYKLYKEGNWNWTKWYSMMSDFVKSAPAGTERYGINGWFQTQIIQQTGKTMVNYDGKTFTNNLNDPDIDRAETLLYNIGKNNLVDTDWKGGAKYVLKAGTTLFFCMGPWALTGSYGPTKTDNWSVVPVPSDPNTDKKYMTSDMTAYMWVAGSKKSDAVKCWFECSRMANTDPTYKEKGKEKFLNANPKWTDEMYQVMSDCSSSQYKQVFDYGYGISPSMSDDNSNKDGNCITRKLYEYTNKTDDDGNQFTWTQLREKYTATVDTELKTINDSIKTFKAE